LRLDTVGLVIAHGDSSEGMFGLVLFDDTDPTKGQKGDLNFLKGEYRGK
jgi:hypothetical protein